MDAHVQGILQECTRGSDEGRLTFPQVVTKLMEAGVERYHADLLRAEKTYYMPNGESHVERAAAVMTEPARDFDTGGVEAAIRSIQAGELSYKEFCERIARAGCVDYVVSLAGKRAIYSGRTGDNHVERFPQ